MGPFTETGQSFTVFDNTVIVGVSGIVQPAYPRVITDICFEGTAFVPYPQVPTLAHPEVNPAQQQFNWCLVWVLNGMNEGDVFANLNPPLYVPSQQMAAEQIVEDAFIPGGQQYQTAPQTYEQDAMTWTQTGKRLAEESTEVSQGDAKFRRPNPQVNDAQEEETSQAQVVVSELFMPRMQVIMGGTGVCTYNSQTVTNFKIKKYNNQKLRVKTGDTLVLMAKSAQGQHVSIAGMISYKTLS